MNILTRSFRHEKGIRSARLIKGKLFWAHAGLSTKNEHVARVPGGLNIRTCRYLLGIFDWSELMSGGVKLDYWLGFFEWRLD